MVCSAMWNVQQEQPAFHDRVERSTAGGGFPAGGAGGGERVYGIFLVIPLLLATQAMQSYKQR